VPAEYENTYRAAFGPVEEATAVDRVEAGRREILGRYLGHAGPVTFETIRERYAFPEEWLRAELERRIEARELLHGRFTPQGAGGTAAEAAEYVERRTLEQIHRRTLQILRREVQPVPLAAYASFLARWQHVHPAERLDGDGALRQVLQQLRAYPVVGPTWERDVLPLRLVAYDPAELDALCQGGEAVWVGSGGVDPRRGKVRFLFRGEGSIYLKPAPEDLDELGEAAQEVYRFLKSEGAVFTGDICAALDLEGPAAETALTELVMAGLVTNDSLEAMRHLVAEGAPHPKGQRPYSSLEEQLARRRGHIERRADRAASRGRSTRWGEKPGRAQYRAAKERVRRRLERQMHVPDTGPPEPRWMGRWTLVHRFGVLGKPLPEGERAARQARQLLARHGIVTYESLADEVGAWEWAPIARQLRRLEMRGEVRRGYFVQGLSGAQYALPEAVERLRAARDAQDEAAALTVLSACDPANLYGPAREGAPCTAAGEPLAFSRLPSTWLVQERGLPVLVASSGGANVVLTEGVDEGLAGRAMGALLDHLARSESRLSVETWNGEPVLGSAGQAVLEGLEFYRDYPAMTWERSYS
jgi:ATP-dependent Lhr-like helicase